MSLDQNLFTLQVKPSETDPTVVDLVDPSGDVFYRKQRISGPVYASRMYDFVTQSLLVTATAPSASSKVKILELKNPSVPVELKASRTFTVKWTFQWEGHEFEWKREECYIIRKPDPPVLVAITKEIPGRVKSSAIQILDYNLNRFDIEDRKGLELIILTSLLTFLDSSDPDVSKEDDHEQATGRKKSTWTTLSPFGIAKTPSSTALNPATATKTPSSSPPSAPARAVMTRAKSSPELETQITPVPDGPSTSRHSAAPVLSTTSHPATSNDSSPPTPPPTPPPTLPHAHDRNRSHAREADTTGVDFIAQILALRTLIHEVTIHEEGTIEDYAEFCWRLLKDEAIGFITVHSSSSSQVQKVLEVVEATKQVRFQKGPYIELLQFVQYYPLPVTSRQKLGERIRFASMTPKEIKKAQKQKEKEEKRVQKLKEKKERKKLKGKAREGKGDSNTFQIEELEIPPKSVQVRLTKVELEQKSAAAQPLISKTADAEDKVPLRSDPRFLVQRPPSEVPLKFYTAPAKAPEESVSAAADARQQQRHRRPVSDVRPAPNRVPATIRSTSQPSLPTRSQPVSELQPRNVASSSTANPRVRSLSGTRLQDTHVQSTPLLPPKNPVGRHADVPEGPIAGGSRQEAPPSYTELLMENEISVDVKN